MKRLLLFFTLISLFVVSCNNEDNADDNPSLNAQNVQQQLKDLVKKYPDSISLRETLIQNYRDSDNYDAAIAEAKNTILIDSANAALWDHLFWLYFENEDTASAIASLEKAVSLNDNPEYYITLGTVYAQTKNNKALLVADRLFKATSGDFKKEALFIKGLFYSATNENEKAIPFFDQSIGLDYTYIDPYREESICFYNLGRYDEAIKKLKMATSVKSDYEVAYYWLGRCYEKLNKKKEAIDNYKLAIQIDPDYDEAKEALKRIDN